MLRGLNLPVPGPSLNRAAYPAPPFRSLASRPPRSVLSLFSPTNPLHLVTIPLDSAAIPPIRPAALQLRDIGGSCASSALTGGQAPQLPSRIRRSFFRASSVAALTDLGSPFPIRPKGAGRPLQSTSQATPRPGGVLEPVAPPFSVD